MADKIPDISPNVDETMKELETHGSFELPVETYTDNCEIFRSLYNHWHKEMEIICIDKGNGLARLNRETLRLKEGDLLIVNSGVLHGIKSDSRHILYYRSVVFDLSFLAGPAGDLCQEKVISLLMENRAEFTHLITPANENYNNIFHLFCEIHKCHKEKPPFYYMKLKGLFYGLFYEMLAGNYIITTDAEQNRNLLSVKKVLDYISAHYREPLSVKELSGLSNYSEFYFMKLFKQYTGKTAAAYLNDYRLEKAKSLLLHTDASVTDIALDVGFNNTSYFIKNFRKPISCPLTNSAKNVITEQFCCIFLRDAYANITPSNKGDVHGIRHTGGFQTSIIHTLSKGENNYESFRNYDPEHVPQRLRSMYRPGSIRSTSHLYKRAVSCKRLSRWQEKNLLYFCRISHW